MSNRIGRNPFEVNDIVPLCEIGGIYEHKDTTTANTGWGIFRYVRFLDAVTYLRGQVTNPAAYVANIPHRVTNDRSGGTGVDGEQYAGIVCAVMSQNYYGFVQVGGIALVIGDGAVASAESVIPHTVDGEADTMAAGEEDHVFGAALDADGTGNDPLAVSTMFHCRLLGL